MASADPQGPDWREADVEPTSPHRSASIECESSLHPGSWQDHPPRTVGACRPSAVRRRGLHGTPRPPDVAGSSPRARRHRFRASRARTVPGPGHDARGEAPLPAPAQPGPGRLGVRFSSTEALHGVAWRGPAVTYPQPVGLAATWDEGLLAAVGDQIAREVREHHAQEDPASLNVWSPVVNPLRHPLWGRTEEGLSEDPLLNARLGTAIARGLRGEGPCWTTVPTLKHFLGYSHEVDRAATSSSLPPRVLHEYELPGYEEALASGAAGAVMLSYNLVDGVPAHLAAGERPPAPRGRDRICCSWSAMPGPTSGPDQVRPRISPRRSRRCCGPA